MDIGRRSHRARDPRQTQMIHTIPIPRSVSRVGCTPGGSCCSSCAGGNMGAITFGRGPNTVLPLAPRTPQRYVPPIIATIGPGGGIILTPYARGIVTTQARGLRDVQCDQDGNCYDTTTGAYTPGAASVAASLSVSPSSAASTIGSWISGNSTLLVGLAAAVSVLAFATGGGKGRRR